ncbi:hypothetical protein O4H49_03255 [Kiloniella laminariae]|uniref:Uncharacterized protein n=2 Tax=Kiloniella laminariae TaxID=454162 RepID=A0ABT4LHE3_9PROT|nr:hypothetical protein [Kiloniella laminariae]
MIVLSTAPPDHWPPGSVTGHSHALLVYLLVLACPIIGLLPLYWSKSTACLSALSKAVPVRLTPAKGFYYLFYPLGITLSIIAGLSYLASIDMLEPYYLLPGRSSIPFIGFVAGFCFLPAFVQPNARRHNPGGRLCRLLYRGTTKTDKQIRTDITDASPSFRPLLVLVGVPGSLLFTQLCYVGYFSIAEARRMGELNFFGENILHGEISRSIVWLSILSLLLGPFAWAIHCLLFVRQQKKRPSLGPQANSVPFWETLLTSVFSGGIAVITMLQFPFPFGHIEPAFFIGGLVAGYLILPRFFSRDRWQFFRAFFAGAMTILLAGIIAGFLITIHASWDFLVVMYMTAFAVIFFLPIALIGGIAALLLDGLLYHIRRRQIRFTTAPPAPQSNHDL